MLPLWLIVLAICSLGIALLCAGRILVDVVKGHHQMMPVMNWVWPITALYFGPVALWAYCSMGRPLSKPAMMRSIHQEGGHDESQEMAQRMKTRHKHIAESRPFWQTTWIGVTHCGAGCTLGDLIGEWAIFILGVEIARRAYWPNILLDFALAYLLGIAFQYFSIAPMRGISGLKGIWAAIQADTLSLIAFEIGLFAWMALFTFAFFPALHPDNPVYWFLMQIGMVIGFGTAYPMNWWLLKHGIKEKM